MTTQIIQTKVMPLKSWEKAYSNLLKQIQIENNQKMKIFLIETSELILSELQTTKQTKFSLQIPSN